MGDRINNREIEEIQAATPVLYELKPLSDGTHQLGRVHRIRIVGDQHFVLQEIMPGHLQAYVMLADGCAVAYEEVSFDDAPHVTEKHRERLIAENAALCRRISCPPPAPLVFAKSKPWVSNDKAKSSAPPLASGPLKHRRETGDSTAEANKR